MPLGGDDDMTQEISRALGRIEGQLSHFDKRIDDVGRTTETAINALRQDVVHANTEVRRQVSDHEVRISTLEDDKIARGGVFKLAAVLKDYSPWLLAAGVGVVAWLK